MTSFLLHHTFRLLKLYTCDSTEMCCTDSFSTGLISKDWTQSVAQTFVQFSQNAEPHHSLSHLCLHKSCTVAQHASVTTRMTLMTILEGLQRAVQQLLSANTNTFASSLNLCYNFLSASAHRDSENRKCLETRKDTHHGQAVHSTNSKTRGGTAFIFSFQNPN